MKLQVFMGKSYKQPIFTDYNKKSKKISHSKFRKKVKQKIQEQRFEEIPSYEREVTNPYDISDYSFRIDRNSEWYSKSKRK